MGCGCKKKQNSSPSTQKSVASQPTKSNNTSVQESIRKVVEKYYKK